jgi:hypothetical protein
MTVNSDFIITPSASGESENPTIPAGPQQPPVEEVPAKEVPAKEVPTKKVSAISVNLLSQNVQIEIAKGYYKYISYADFIDLLKRNADEGDTGESAIQTIYSPTGMFFFEKTKTRIKLCNYYEGGIRNVKYKDHDRPSVFPNVIITHSLVLQGNEYLVEDSRYYATKSSLAETSRNFITTSFGVSILPFTNIYENGRMCYGNNIKISKFKLPDLRGLHSYYQLLFDAPFNDDLGLTALVPKWRDDVFSKWYSHLAKLATENKPFPYEDLRAYN